ncbi:MAG: DUF6498-containing protein [Chloroflexota bacterium]|nr:DUF6498-containing protein [Chloroflexota bacterium]
MLAFMTRLDAIARSSGLAVVMLVASNAIPIVGVLFLGWDILTLLVLYWIESGVIGLINVLKMARAEGPHDLRPGTSLTFSGPPGCAPTAAKAFMIPFFIFHYGVFWVVHGVFVFLLPLFAGLLPVMAVDGRLPQGASVPPLSGAAISIEGILLAAGALTISHAVSYYLNFIRRGEYRRVSVISQMARPYGRVVILHLTIILGAVLVATLGQPIALLVLLVGLKTALDLALHVRSHRSAGHGPTSPGPDTSLIRTRNL